MKEWRVMDEPYGVECIIMRNVWDGLLNLTLKHTKSESGLNVRPGNVPRPG